jgi:predicted phosphoribosyltransferase
MVDKIITLVETDDFYAVGQFYQNFPQVTDAEVLEILGKDSKKYK